MVTKNGFSMAELTESTVCEHPDKTATDDLSQRPRKPTVDPSALARSESQSNPRRMKVECDRMTKAFGKRTILDRVSLQLPEGRVVSLLGINGAGKTTLLRLLAGVFNPDSGTISFDGKPFQRGDLGQRARIFFLPDFPPLLMGETVLGHIGLTIRMFGRDAVPGIESQVCRLMEEFALLPLIDAQTHTLSRGQSYKTALVALLAVDPDLWLLDEPFASGMDPGGLSALKRHLRAAADRGRTVVFSTQIVEVLRETSDQVIVIRDTGAELHGTAGDLSAAVIAGLQRSKPSPSDGSPT